MNTKFGALSSSVDPQKLASTVTGFIKVAGGVLAYLGYTQITGDLNSVADQIGVVVTLGYAFYGACEALFGLVRKVIVGLQTKFNS